MLRRHAPSKRGFKSPMLVSFQCLFCLTTKQKKPSAAVRPVEKTPNKRTTDDEDIAIANKRLKLSPMEQSTSKTVLPKVKKGPRRFVSPAVSASTHRIHSNGCAHCLQRLPQAPLGRRRHTKSWMHASTSRLSGANTAARNTRLGKMMPFWRSLVQEELF